MPGEEHSSKYANPILLSERFRVPVAEVFIGEHIPGKMHTLLILRKQCKAEESNTKPSNTYLAYHRGRGAAEGEPEGREGAERGWERG